mmetsp:Transcript_5023/g.11527  ORF Transcript_5023/g.11527 Transcript_5023/m.11527 type:complete len:253 (+) Transcript_5023:1894-2652(+)
MVDDLEWKIAVDVIEAPHVLHHLRNILRIGLCHPMDVCCPGIQGKVIRRPGKEVHHRQNQNQDDNQQSHLHGQVRHELCRNAFGRTPSTIGSFALLSRARKEAQQLPQPGKSHRACAQLRELGHPCQARALKDVHKVVRHQGVVPGHRKYPHNVRPERILVDVSISMSHDIGYELQDKNHQDHHQSIVQAAVTLHGQNDPKIWKEQSQNQICGQRGLNHGILQNGLHLVATELHAISAPLGADPHVFDDNLL